MKIKSNQVQNAPTDRRKQQPPLRRIDARKPHPLERTNLIQNLLFEWVSPYLKNFKKNKKFDQKNHYKIPAKDKFSNRKEPFRTRLETSKNLFSTVLKTLSKHLAGVVFIVTLAALLEFSVSIFTEEALDLISTTSDFTKPDTFFILLLDLTVIAVSVPVARIAYFQVQFWMDRQGMRIATALYSFIHSKILEVKSARLGCLPDGFVINLVQIDAVQVWKLIWGATRSIQYLIQSVVALMFLIANLGFGASLRVLGVYFGVNLLLILAYWLRYKFSDLYLKAKDLRMGAFGEVIHALEYIKSTATELKYWSDVSELRYKEFINLRKIAYVYTLDRFVGDLAYIAVQIYVVYDCYNNRKSGDFSYGQFTALVQLINGFCTFFMYFEFEALNTIFFWPSFARIQRFLDFFKEGENEEKLRYRTGIGASEARSGVVALILNGNFEWEVKNDENLEIENFPKFEAEQAENRPNRGNGNKNVRRGHSKSKSAPMALLQARNLLLTGESETDQNQPTNDSKDPKRDQLVNNHHSNHPQTDQNNRNFKLQKISLRIQKNEITAIIGKSNSGKSSLLQVFLEEMPAISPITEEMKVKVQGSISYLSQKRWLIEGSIRHNIMIEQPFDPELMAEVLILSELSHDIDDLENGLETILNAEGDNISGGQKTRVCLARCLYQK